ncbi:hypothetical protein [Streptomyces sp. NPDC056165]|uniref:hypothetical protein n=1 Tax=Streptomyces sp. NPDC056165 TaxID=3345733 RepID=UPI0035DF10C1
MHVNSELLNTAAGAVGAVALVFIGGWENDRRTRKTDARKDAAADRAALEAQANELVTAVLALKVAGNTHDHLWGGRAAALVSGRRGAAALPALAEEAGRVVERWENDSAVSAAGLAAPLSRLGAAVAPLLRREEPGLAAAADAVFMAAAEGYGDDARMARALEDFHAALRPALVPPPLEGRRWALHRRRSAGE